MKIEWYGHSCFKISAHDYAVVLDPYKPGMIPGLGEYHIHANQVLTSHQHADHNYVQAVTLDATDIENPFKETFLDTFHDDEGGKVRGPNKITILECDGIKMAHMGDLGTYPTPEQYRALHNLDVLMIPVGGYFTIDAKEAKEIVDILHPNVVIPMHYRGKHFGPPVIGPVKHFTRLFDDRIIHEYPTNELEITKETQPQIVVFTYVK